MYGHNIITCPLDNVTELQIALRTPFKRAPTIVPARHVLMLVEIGANAACRNFTLFVWLKMKFLDSEEKIWLALQAERSLLHRLHRQGRRYRSAAPLPPEKDGPHRIVAPLEMNFNERYEDTASFIERIRRFSLTKNLPIYIDLQTCRKISPAAALVLAAEVQRATELRPDRVNGRDPVARSPYMLMRQLGFHELLEIPGRPRIRSRSSDDLQFATMVSGAIGRPDQFPVLLDLVFGEKARLTGIPARNALTKGLSEAMHNVMQHAYADPEKLAYEASGKFRWWMAGFRDPKRKEVTFLFYDQGITIPASLRKTWSERASAIFKRLTGTLGAEDDNSYDGEMIKAAIGIGRTSTDKDGRGWGLSEMRDLVANSSGERDSVLGILSRRGFYTYTSSGAELARSNQTPFWGTLIVWRLAGNDKIVWS